MTERENDRGLAAPPTKGPAGEAPPNARLQLQAVRWQAITAIILLAGAVVAIIGWITDAETRRTDRTLDYINRTTEREFIDHLWDLQDFTICFERHKGAHISYLRYSDVTAAPNRARSLQLARDWWQLIENESATMEECGKPFDVERRLMVVYGRLEALASCSATGVCDFNAFRKMIEAFDYLTVLSVSNYLLLAGTEEGVSREWSNTGSFKELVVRIENYVFDQTRPALSAAQREEVWKKESSCERPPGGQDGPWRWCLSGQKPPD